LSRQVTLCINSLRGGGAERVCATLAGELAALGWDVEILVLNLRDAVVRSAVPPGIPVVDLGVQHARSSPLALARYLRRRRPGRFLVFNHQLAVLLAWLRALRVGRFEIVARNISTLSRKAEFEPSFWHRRIVHGLTRAFYRHVDLVIAQSKGMKSDLVERYGFDRRRVRVINNPLAGRYSPPWQDSPVPWQEREEEIVYVGRLEPIKGLELLIDACALCMRRRAGLALRLVGTGPQGPALERRVAAAGLAGRVTFQGYVADPAPFYRRAKLLALTSRYEGFPNVLVEAMSQGTPVVAVDCDSGPAEIVEEGRNGFLARDRDPRTFAQAIERALSTEWNVESVRRSVARFGRREIALQYAAALLAAPAPD
jgi:glycosyltransferase involved in cell wall biosynthesis